MKNIYFKVNRRYVFICFAFVLTVAILTFNLRDVYADTKPSIFGDIFHSVMPAGDEPITQSPIAPTLPPGTGTPPAYPSVTPGSILSGTPAPVPAGECEGGLNRALNNLDSHAAQVIPVYQQASAESGVPWEILAAVHYVETGGSFNPNLSLTCGWPLNEPDESPPHTIHYTLINSARAAADIFKQKYGAPPYNDFRRLVSAFAGYNGYGNRQCRSDAPSIPKPQSNYSGCPALYDDEDHLYPLACYDTRHQDMWKIYCGTGTVCPNYDSNNPTHHKYSPSMVGALTLIAGIQARSQPTPTVLPGTPTPPGLPGSPAFGNEIIQEVRSIYGAPIECTYSPFPRLCIEINTSNVERIMNAVSKAGQAFKTQVTLNTNRQGTLQCVGAAFGLSAEINGVIPQVGHDAACQFTDTTAVHQFYRYGDPGVAPQPGDLVVWNPSVGFCSNTNAGHIAYIMEVIDAQNVVVGEGSWGRSGNISVRRPVRLNSHAPIGFLRKK